MEIKKQNSNDAFGIKIIAEEQGKEIGRAYLYILRNDLHTEPFGLLEDLFVEETHRGKGIGSLLVKEVIATAKEQGCYKLLCTSRHERLHLHEWYKKYGFRDHGIELRFDFIV